MRGAERLSRLFSPTQFDLLRRWLINKEHALRTAGDRRPLLLVAQVAAVIGCAIMGDSLLYGILPLAATGLAISPEQVGLLLSLNRLVRLFSNTWLSFLFARFGPRWPFLIAAGLGVLTTILYGVNLGFAVFVLARLGWGIAWSSLRQGGYQAVWSGGDGQAGRLMGVLWGIIRFGSAISVLIGGYLFDRVGYQSTVFVIAGLSLMALPIAMSVRWPKAAGSETPTKIAEKSRFIEGWRAAMHDPLQQEMVLIGALKPFFDAILVATASLYLANYLGAGEAFSQFGVGTVAGAVLATRWLSDLLAGPFVGIVSDRWGQVKVAGVLLALLLASLVASLVLSGLAAMAAFLFVLVLSTGVNVTLDATAQRIALRASSPPHFIGVYTTLADAGSAMGPLLALPLVATLGFAPAYLPVGVLLWIVVVHFGRKLQFSSVTTNP